MNLADPIARAAWTAELGAIFRGRKVIAGFAVLAAYAGEVRLLREVGAQRPMLITTSRGAGPVPGPDEAEVVHLPPVSYATMTEEVRGRDALARQLPGQVLAAIEAYDPDGTAVWHVDPFVENTPLLGRRVYGGRPAAWLAVEDKLVAEQVWQELDLPRAPTLVVPADLGALRRAAADLDLGEGTVWAGDASGGMHGGGDFVRWVVTEQEQKDAAAFFDGRCDRVRVMPFLEGVPCSIHGIVLPDGVAALRPVELAMLRRAGTREFVYGGLGTTWDPPAADRDQMRELVRRTGEHLRDRVDYRGFLGIDGVLTQDGFRPTEINARMSGGAVTLARLLDEDALVLLQTNLVAGLPPGVTVAQLEGWMLPALEERRTGKPIAVTSSATVTESMELQASWDGCRLRRLEPGTTASGDVVDLIVGPTGTGTFAKVTTEDAVGPGERIAPLNLALTRFLDEEFGTSFGTLEAAPDVR